MSLLQFIPLSLTIAITSVAALKLPSFETRQARTIEGATLSVLLLAQRFVGNHLLIAFDRRAALVLLAYVSLRLLRGPKDIYLLPCAALAASTLVAGRALLDILFCM